MRIILYFIPINFARSKASSMSALGVIFLESGRINQKHFYAEGFDGLEKLLRN